MKKLLIISIFISLRATSADLSKCNIDTQGDPNNKPDCYKDFPATLKAGLTTKGWPDGTLLKSSPNEPSKTVAKLVTSGHWIDQEIEFTGKTDGVWAEVILRKFKTKMESCDAIQTEKWNKKGWIKAFDKTGKPIIWIWLYSGLC